MRQALHKRGMILPDCPQCLKMPALCVCDLISKLSTQIQVLILQHPQEPDHELGTARMAHLALPNSQLKIGLSWPNLSKALGSPAQASEWAVLYLGSGIKGKPTHTPLQFVSQKGLPIDPPSNLKGIVILDGTWSQAKALWWRNAWLLKLKRAVLNSPQKSLYRELRKEPRKECLSTIESIAETLVALGEPSTVGEELRKLFAGLLEKKRNKKKGRAPILPIPNKPEQG